MDFVLLKEREKCTGNEIVKDQIHFYNGGSKRVNVRICIFDEVQKMQHCESFYPGISTHHQDSFAVQGRFVIKILEGYNEHFFCKPSYKVLDLTIVLNVFLFIIIFLSISSSPI